MPAQQKLYTVEDLWELSQRVGDQMQFELVRGEIVERVPVGGEHGRITAQAYLYIGNHVLAEGLGRVTAAETGYILANNPPTVRAPGVAFVSAERTPNPLPERYFPLAPDLVVEVVSPSDTVTDIREKTRDYLHAGTQLVWVIYPADRTVDVLRRTSDGIETRLLDTHDTLHGGDVLPGFHLRVRELFPE